MNSIVSHEHKVSSPTLSFSATSNADSVIKSMRRISVRLVDNSVRRGSYNACEDFTNSLEYFHCDVLFIGWLSMVISPKLVTSKFTGYFLINSLKNNDQSDQTFSKCLCCNGNMGTALKTYTEAWGTKK
jgi:hypothetical protein